MKLVLKVFKTVLSYQKKLIFKNRLKHLKRKCFSVLREKQSCLHGAKDGCKNLRFSFKLLKPFSLSSEQGLKKVRIKNQESECLFYKNNAKKNGTFHKQIMFKGGSKHSRKLL